MEQNVERNFWGLIALLVFMMVTAIFIKAGPLLVKEANLHIAKKVDPDAHTVADADAPGRMPEMIPPPEQVKDNLWTLHNPGKGFVADDGFIQTSTKYKSMGTRRHIPIKDNTNYEILIRIKPKDVGSRMHLTFYNNDKEAAYKRVDIDEPLPIVIDEYVTYKYNVNKLMPNSNPKYFRVSARFLDDPNAFIIIKETPTK